MRTSNKCLAMIVHKLLKGRRRTALPDEPHFEGFRRRLSGASPSYGVCQAAEKRR